jgi:membrane associated rhomboid family serine protease
MRDAAVGHQCVECVNAGGANAPRASRLRRAGSTTPVVTYTLIAVNVVVFVLQLMSPGLEGTFALWPPAVAGGDYYRLVTSAFLHYGVTHILFNMWALYVVGPPLEMWLGRLRFTALYALSALGGSVLVYLLAPLNSATAGASAAIFGLFGAMFVMAKRLNLNVRSVGAIIVINLVFTLVVPLVSSQQISWQGHVGGLITGSLIALAYGYGPSDRRNRVQWVATAAALVLFVALIWWRTDYLLTAFGQHIGLG